MRGLAAKTSLLVSKNIPAMKSSFFELDWKAESINPALFVSSAQNQGDSTMITSVFSTKAPENCAAIAIEVNWLVAFSVVATAARTNSFTTAVIVRH